MEPHSEVKAVWVFETRQNADNATLASYAQSLIARTVLCRSPVNARNQNVLHNWCNSDEGECVCVCVKINECVYATYETCINMFVMM